LFLIEEAGLPSALSTHNTVNNSLNTFTKTASIDLQPSISQSSPFHAQRYMPFINRPMQALYLRQIVERQEENPAFNRFSGPH
jgi:hypothetical protein